LGYSTLNQAFRETVARPIVDAVYQALHSNRSLLDIATDKEHLGNIGVQVGGFGKMRRALSLVQCEALFSNFVG